MFGRVGGMAVLTLSALVVSGCGSVSSGSGAPTSGSHPSTLSALTITPVTTSWPQGDRAGAFDAARRTLWVVTRVDGANTLILDAYSPVSGTDKATLLSADGADWAGGSVVVTDPLVWVAWGHRVASFDPVSGAIRTHVVPWAATPDDGIAGRIDDMVIDASGRVCVVAAGRVSVDCLNPVSNAWTRLPLPAGDTVDSGTRLATVEGMIAINVGPKNSRPAVEGTWWIAPNDATVLSSGNNHVVTVTANSMDVTDPHATTDTVTYSIPGPSTPPWAEPVAADDSRLWEIQQTYMRETLVTVDLSTGTTSKVDVPLEYGQAPYNGWGHPNPNPSQVVAFDPALAEVVPAENGVSWVLTRNAGGTNGGYPAVYRAALS
jgi:hypothetical protein